jgi:transposase-like protein
MGEHRRAYAEKLKRNALELLRKSGKSAAAVAWDLSIESGVPKHWRREQAKEGNSKKAFTGRMFLETKR